MRDDLQYDLCLGCGEKAPEGLIAFVRHSCPANIVSYYRSNFSMRKLNNIMTGKDDLSSFKALLVFPYFKRMPNFDTATATEKMIYGICRDSDIRTMKRLRAYIELEEKFDASY